MTDGKIDDFFTPKNRKAKRPKPGTSPEDDGQGAAMGSGKVGDLTYDQLMEGFNSLLDAKLSNLATKEDLAGISGKVTTLTEENVRLRREIDNLKSQEGVILSKLLDLEGRSRRNNLIFHGLQWGGKRPDYKEIVMRFCREVLQDGGKTVVNRAHPLGKDGKAIIAHIPYDPDIDYIMMHARDLKGSGYAVHRDYPREVRVKRACLSALRVEIERVTGRTMRMPLTFDHLLVNGCRLTWESGRLMAGRADGGEKLQEMFGHDFSDFLAGLRQRPLGRTNESAINPQPIGTGTSQATSQATTAEATVNNQSTKKAG